MKNPITKLVAAILTFAVMPAGVALAADADGTEKEFSGVEITSINAYASGTTHFVTNTDLCTTAQNNFGGAIEVIQSGRSDGST